MHKITINNLTGYKLVFFLLMFLLSFQAKAQFPFFESFKNSTAPSTQFGGSPTAFLTAGAGLKDNYNDAEGEGYLRLTNYKEDQKGFVWWDQLAFPSGNGMTISFEYYSFGGNYPGTRAADGIAFVLFDATASPITPGAYGSGLGYAQNTSSNPKQNGFSKGYLGIGLDESGNFSTTSDGKTGGVSLEYDRITLRGAGTGLTGYPYLTSIQTTSLPGGFFVKGNIRDVTVSSDLNGFRKAEIVLTPRPTGGFFINVYITHNKIKTLVINNYAYTTPPPASLKMAITSSTGALTSYHEIRNLQITTDLTTLLNPIANPDTFSGPAGEIAISSDITANDNGAVNKFGTVNKQTIDLDPSIPGIQTTTTIVEKGTFTYDSATGKVTFTPVDNKVITPVTIYYNFNDSYGKTSNTSTITYTPTCTTIIDNTITLQSLPFFCNNDSGNGVMIMGSNLDASSVNYLWESSTDNITFKSTDGITRNYAPNPFSVTTYFRRKVTSGTCTSISNVVSIISKSSIEQPILNNVIQPTCTNAKGSFTIINYDPLFTYEILPNTGVLQNGETINAPAGNYTVVAKVENCISSTSLPIQISTQSSLPPVPTISTITQPTCSKVMGSLTITNYNIAYTYEMNPAAGTTIIGNQVTAPEGNYTLVAKSGTCVSSEATISINAQPETPATPILSAITQPSCTNQIGRFTITNYNPAYTYEMSPPTGTIIGNQITVSSGTYTIAAKSGSCRSIISAYAKINSLPIKDADVVTTESICSGQTYTWPANGITYSTSQTGLKTTNDGCTADQVLNLTVGSKPADVVTTESICSGTIFHWDVTGMDYSSSGTYTKTNDGCTANQVLKLTIKDKPADITTNETRCSGETFHWNVTGLDYNATGTYTKNNDGCTADQILNLTITPKPADIIETITYCEGEFHYSLHKDINDGCTADIVYEYVMIPKPADIVTTESICSGHTYTWPANGITYSTSQNALKIVNDGCTADQVLNLTVGSKPADIVTTESICSGQTYTWPANGITYSTSQTGLKITNNGCTADQILNLTITPKPADIITNKIICPGEIYVWQANNTAYSTNQNGLRISNHNCEADQVLNLTINDHPFVTIDNATICEGDTYIWSANNQTYTTPQNGLQYRSENCERIGMLFLEVKTKPKDIITKETICLGQTYTWPANGVVYSESASLKIEYNGCIADQILNLTVGSKPADIVTTESICSGQTFTWPANGITYSTSQTGLKITNDGCTADQVLNLTVTPKPADIVTTELICSGQTFKWPANGITYSTLQNALKIVNDGCTADQVLNLTVGSKPADIVTSESICSGQTFTWPANGITYSTSQTDLKTTNDGCTADQVLNLTVTPKPADIVTTESICFGQTFTWPANGITYSTSQTGLKITNDGCTADQVLNLTVGSKPADIVTSESICSGQTFTWPANGITYSTSQTGLKITNDGCTADQVLNLNVGSKPADIVTTESICSGQTYTWPANGITYSTSQTGLKITNDGCTADQVLNLTVTPKPADIITSESICSGQTFTWPANGIIYSTSQTGLKITNDGCTADQVLNLTIGSKPADIVTSESICSGQTYTWPANGTTYSTSQNALKIVNDGCTADQILNLTVGSKPTDIVTAESICSGQTFTWPANGITYSTSQNALKIVNDGCTADQVLNLTVGSKPLNIVTSESMCSGQTYTWPANGITYSTSQTDLKITNDGCTADQVLNLTVGSKPADIVTSESICSEQTFKWPANGITYSTSQTDLKITNDGCTADQVLNLTVTPKPADIITTESICSGQTFTWPANGTAYSTSQNALKIVNDGCTADQVLNLTVGSKPLNIVTSESICSGQTYTWPANGITYSTSQTGLKITNDGCTADQVLNLTVGSKPADIVTAESICSGQTFTWPANGITYSTSQTGLKITNDGCTADQVLNLTIGSKPANIVTTESICSGQTFTWPANGITYSTSQTGLKITNDECTADQVLNLTIGSKPADIVTSESICSGQTFTWPANGITYSTSQTGLKITNDGCTADQVLNLTVTPKPTDIIKTIEICEGDLYPGLEREAKDGCTADIVYQYVLIPKPTDIVTTELICSGQTYTWPANGIIYSTSQTGLKIVNDECTADQVLNLTVGSKPADIVTSESICSGQTFKWPANGITYSTSQTGLKITNDGCTADQVLHLTVGSKPADIVTTESICSGQTFTWPANGIAYSTSQNALKIVNDGCTADQVLNLVVGSKPADIVTTESICSGQTFTWPANGITYSTSQTGLKITNDGCTADQVLNLTVGSKPADIATSESICSGQTYTWPANGITYSTSQTGLKITNDGCTADQVLNLTIKEEIIITQLAFRTCIGDEFINKTVCELISGKVSGIGTPVELPSGLSLIWSASDNTIKLNGSPTELGEFWFSVPLITEDCGNKVAIGNIYVEPKPTVITANETICSGEIFHWNITGLDYNASGTYTKNNDGCTADQILNLTVASKPAAIITNETICSGTVYSWNVTGLDYNTSGTYTKNNDGCTADQILNLTVAPKPAPIAANETICSGEIFHWNITGLDYNTSGTYTKNNDGCTADQILNLTVAPKPVAITANETICSGEAFLWNITGLYYNTSGTYTKNNDGCTADQILNLTVASKPAAIITNETICSGTVYSWNVTGLDYNTSGTYTKNNDGCTADQILNLTVAPKPAPIAANETICSGEVFHWNITGLDYNTSGTYTKNNDGCTADQILNLTVVPKPAPIAANETICSGEVFHWNMTGLDYNASGTYTKNNDGCTADQILNLTVAPKPAAITTNETICSGEVFHWNMTGLDYNTSGTYTKNNDGCIADQILNLTVTPKPAAIITNETICSGTVYSWSVTGLDYNATGTYTKNNDGCTADEVLNLNVSSALTSELIPNTLLRETCNGEQDGGFSIQITGGTVPYKVALNDINGIYQSVIDSDYTFSNLAGGQYIVYIKDALNCTTEQEVTIEDGIAINPIANTNYTCEDNSPSNYVTITVPQSNAISNEIDYSLDGGAFQPENVFKNLSPGSHTITARHLSGCLESTAPFVIDLIQPLDLSLTNRELNEITASGQNGSGNYQYSFEGESFSTNNKFIIYKSGTYNITVRDGSGCTFNTSKYFDYIDLCISNYFTPNGDGISDYWGPDCASSYKKLTYTIFDRYGRELANYHFGQKWDGKYKGQELTSGDYWYVIKLNDPKDNREFVGHFTLYR